MPKKYYYVLEIKLVLLSKILISIQIIYLHSLENKATIFKFTS